MWSGWCWALTLLLLYRRVSSNMLSHLGGQAEGAGRVGQQAAGRHLKAGLGGEVPGRAQRGVEAGFAHSDLAEVVGRVVHRQVVAVV